MIFAALFGFSCRDISLQAAPLSHVMSGSTTSLTPKQKELVSWCLVVSPWCLGGVVPWWFPVLSPMPWWCFGGVLSYSGVMLASCKSLRFIYIYICVYYELVWKETYLAIGVVYAVNFNSKRFFQDPLAIWPLKSVRRLQKRQLSRPAPPVVTQQATPIAQRPRSGSVASTCLPRVSRGK